MKTVIAGAAFAALLCACAANPPSAASPTPASAVAASPGSRPSATKVSSDPNAQICRRDDAPLATHIPQRICRTRAEWDQINKESAEGVDRVPAQIDAARGVQ